MRRLRRRMHNLRKVPTSQVQQGSCSEADAQQRILVVIDTAYTLKAIRERGIESSITCRDLNGFFGRVISVNPISTASLGDSDQWSGPPQVSVLDDRNLFVDASHLSVGWMRRSRSLAPLNFLVSQVTLLTRLCRLVLQHPCSVVRGGDPLYSGLLALTLARITGVPYVIRVAGNSERYFADHGLPAMPRLFRSRSIERRIERAVLSRAAYVIGANEDNLRFAVASGAHPDRTSVIRYGSLLNPQHFSEPYSRPLPQDLFDAWGIESSDRLLVYVGRLERVKRPQDLLAVMTILAAQCDKARLIVVGDGADREALQHEATQRGLGSRVLFVGNQSQDCLARLLPRVDVVLSPHMGRALAEAALAGASVVCYDVDWQSEIIEDHVTGLVVDYGDVKAMSDAVLQLLKDRQLAMQLGMELRAKALDLMDPVMLTQSEREIYERIFREFPAHEKGARRRLPRNRYGRA